MDLVVTHENADFDAIASAVAALALHPGATLALGRRVQRPVRDFLALHRDRFPFTRTDHLDLDAVERLIVVDVRNRRRLKHVEPVLARRAAGEPIELFVYDHHPATDDDLTGDHELVEPVGAAVTLIVERMQAMGHVPAPMEATLFALGIYTDTAALTLGHTSPRDARAVGWLLEEGASLPMVNRYLHPPLNDRQRRVLGRLLSNTKTTVYGGLRVGFARVDTTKHVEGLAEVTTEACKLEDLAGLFTVCQVGEKGVEVVARSRTPLLDVGAVLRAHGGGGHRGAASAVLKGAEADAVLNTLRADVEGHPPRPRRVAEVMSSPVSSVGPTVRLDVLGERLEREGVRGMPVVRDGELVGVISRRDVARAARAGRAHLPVASHMSGQPRTVDCQLSLERALAMMVDADVGRLPVLRDGKLVGILSRSDVLRVLYPQDAAPPPPRP
jgi:tRNA nucleotidyltransferase (CCA-adding enzyme)